MADLRDCITSAMADGHISQDAGAEYIQRYDELGSGEGGLYARQSYSGEWGLKRPWR